MASRRSTTVGLGFLLSAFVLALFRFALPFVWDAVLVAGRADVFLGQPVHGFWVPVLSDVVLVGAGILGFLAFVFLWRGRWELGPEYASRIGLALLAVVAAAAALGAWAASGLLLGFFAGASVLIPWRDLLAFVATVLLGFAVYWILSNLPFPGMRPVAAVALALGVAGGAVTYVATLGVRRGEALGLRSAGVALSLVSLGLWLLLCAWSWQSLRTGRAGPPVGASSPGS